MRHGFAISPVWPTRSPKKWLLALAEKYDPAKPLRATPLPAVAIPSKHSDRNGGGSDAG
jgi:hypothetical protein